MQCCGCIIPKDKTKVFVINESKLQANKQTVNKIINTIRIINGNRFYSLGITKSPNKRVKKHNINNNLKYLYLFGFANYTDAM